MNAGYAGPVTLEVTEGDPEWFRRNFDVNVLGAYYCARYLVPLLVGGEGAGPGAFIQIGSLAAGLVEGPIANTGYCVSKFAQSRLVEMVGRQFGGRGVVAVVVHPGAVATRMAAGNTPEVFLECEFLLFYFPFFFRLLFGILSLLRHFHSSWIFG